jgi:exosome complex component RRP40
MKIRKIRTVRPGDAIKENGRKSLGIYKGMAVVAGNLMEIEKNKYFIDSKTKRYEPSIDDIIIGQVIYKHTDFYKIDMFHGCHGHLPALSFPNTTKRNKPELMMDVYVLCKIVRKGTECLLSCVGDGLGALNNNVFDLECWKVRRLLLCDYLKDIGKTKRFKIALGMNGKIWIDSECPLTLRDVYLSIIDNEWTSRYRLE